MTNKLINESSPYLQQHKTNPVNWWPYGEEAFKEAEEQNKPIFLSIGYSTCHWCHVMARESFMNVDTADFMNQHFINVKMDREEYPGIDRIYQEAFQIMHQRGGGWPLSCYLFPNGKPFYIGTYFPDKPRHGMPSFMQVNVQLIDYWKNKKEPLLKQTENMDKIITSMYNDFVPITSISEELYYRELIHLQSNFDATNGGIGKAPKFPRISTLRFILQEAAYKNFPKLMDFILFSLHKMGKGGIYDQIGGGFARYSVDSAWIIPHFEKMLYDNAGLITIGAELYALTKDDFVKFLVMDTITWIAREMRSPNKMFFSAVNADSEGVEGKFYIWTKEEIKSILLEDFAIAEKRYGITDEGNFQDPHNPDLKGLNVLHISNTIDDIANQLKINSERVIETLNSIRLKIFNVRESRIRPSTDEKIITAWNSQMIKALFISADLLSFKEAETIAISCLNQLTNRVIRDNYVLRTIIDTSERQTKIIEGVLDDYSFLISSLLTAFESTDSWEYIRIADNLVKMVDSKFYNVDNKLYQLNPIESNLLNSDIVQFTDDSMASGIGVMIENLFKLGKYIENEDYVKRGEEISLILMGKNYSGSMNQVFLSTTNYLRYPVELVMIGDQEWMSVYKSIYLPNRLIYRWNENNKNDGRPQWKILENRVNVSKPTVFLCKGMTCSLPIESESQFIQELQTIFS
ncbi:MAG: thioredoxin domain-containing protein [Candidatus Heimdallarchaeota archaeon]|nr:thioredoxin domain-containing protein [Candidatus Heimdallarchaeota archaeon]